MKFSYYPGCTLKTKAKDLDAYGRRSAEALGITLEELPEWQCCGAVYPMAKDEIATKLSSVRALVSARDLGNDLVTLCSACHHVIKRVNGDMKNDDNVRLKVNNYLQLETPYEGETKVIHYLEMLRDVVGFDELKKKVVNPLKGRKIGAYYGCMLLRPSKEMQFDNPENPTIIEDFIKAIGGTPVIVSGKPEFDLRVALNPIHPSFRVVVLIQKSIGSPDVNVWYCLQPAAQNRRMGEDNDRHIGSGVQKLCQGSEGFLC